MPKKPAPAKIYTLTITLDESDPPIWRRFQVTDVTTLGGLHDIVQAVMGWENDHMHEFEVKGKRYAAKSPFGDMPGGMFDDEGGLDEDEVLLGDVIRRKGQRISYWYDFGDDWRHTIKVEAIEAPEAKKRYPVCLDGQRSCPPEDCGGLYGYYDMLKILKDPEHDEYGEYLEWLGDDFDPEAFDLEAINGRLKRIGRAR